MNILIVGAGLTGSTLARELAEVGHKITIIEKRDHVAGNAYDYTDETGIRVHKYGPHLFHTNNKRVWEYLSRFTNFIYYRHKAKAQLKDGSYVPFPVNETTIEKVGKENVLDIFFRPYTKKMWGKELEELDPNIIKRVPVKDNRDESYFPNDMYQGLPDQGYTTMVEKMLDHPNIEVKLNTEFDMVWMNYCDYCFNSMPIDEYHGFVYGELPYRSLKFHKKVIPMNKVLPSTTVNFTHDGPYTRVTEWKNMPAHGNNPHCSVLTFEEPCDYRDNDMERYYPVKDVDGENRKIYEKYKEMTSEKMQFIGRCGQYVYIDMHQAVNSALQIADKFKKEYEV